METKLTKRGKSCGGLFDDFDFFFGRAGVRGGDGVLWICRGGQFLSEVECGGKFLMEGGVVFVEEGV